VDQLAGLLLGETGRLAGGADLGGGRIIHPHAPRP
jgi:hypothetical protein